MNMNREILLPPDLRKTLKNNLTLDIDNKLKGITLGHAFEGMIEIFYKKLLIKNEIISNRKWKQMDLEGKVDFIADNLNDELREKYHMARKLRNFCAHYNKKNVNDEEINNFTLTVNEMFIDILCIYFSFNKFGSELPVMSALSILPPNIRVQALEKIHEKDYTNIDIIDKLTMAYLKDDRLIIAINLLDMLNAEGVISYLQKSQFQKKFASLDTYLPKFDISSNLDDTRRKFEDFYSEDNYNNYKEFIWIIFILLYGEE